MEEPAEVLLPLLDHDGDLEGQERQAPGIGRRQLHHVLERGDQCGRTERGAPDDEILEIPRRVGVVVGEGPEADDLRAEGVEGVPERRRIADPGEVELLSLSGVEA